ncbi:hypothetical protein MIND_00915500 [Mycena indigotica]|uniref:DUF4419 domain-containing protein n=1 Tax=Mycena indigotica TaxID=2126181 RepID=A0A8H6SDB0_9AGAR|nr:uncharacterized protein MIND_00915500 [Mycena indigotica]KAF7296842.1 hypothetical protein MIND_00915500 [Mycena indigotica]
MPVTFTVATHKASPVKNAVLDGKGLTAREIYGKACPPNFSAVGKLRGSSFEETDVPYKPYPLTLHTDLDDPAGTPTKKGKLARLSGIFSKKSAEKAGVVAAPESAVKREPPFRPVKRNSPHIPNVVPQSNGLVYTIASAYNQHHALVLRPDDIWLAILAQFNFFVNANAELLRANFVAHEDKKELQVTRDVMADFGEFSRAMVGEIEKNVVDPTLRAWIIPDFSTTTEKDVTVASIVLMATLKAYFTYVFDAVCCGIPRVTLEGQKADWEKLLARAEKLKEYGIEPTAWYHLLVPVLTRFVKTFDAPYSPEIQAFWGKVAHFEQGGSGPDTYTGWIAAFCVWDQHGKWVGPWLKSSEQVIWTTPPYMLSAKDFWKQYLTYPDPGMYSLQLDDSNYHQVGADAIPPAYADVDVTLTDQNAGTITKALITAGMVGMEVCSSGDKELSEEGKNDVVRPVAGWWLLEKLNQGD